MCGSRGHFHELQQQHGSKIIGKRRLAVWGHTTNQSSVLGSGGWVLIAGSCAVGCDAPITSLQFPRWGLLTQTLPRGCSQNLTSRPETSQTITRVIYSKCVYNDLPDFSQLWQTSSPWRWLSSGMLCPDDGGSKDLWNAGKLLPDYTALQPRRQSSSHPPPWESLPWYYTATRRSTRITRHRDEILINDRIVSWLWFIFWEVFWEVKHPKRLQLRYW
jgi:hypothetical protein